MITVHHLNNSRSQRILWMLEELGTEYRIERYQRHPKNMHAPDSLKKIHPLGKSPVITDESDGGRVIAESGAIIEYLSERFGDDCASLVRPEAGSDAYYQCRYWMHFSEGSLMPVLVIALLMDKVRTSVPFFIKPIASKIAGAVMTMYAAPAISAQLEMIEQHLVKHSWFAGDDMTIADIQMSFPLEASLARGRIPESYKHIRDFVARVHALPAYQRALKAGGDYDYA